jgi:hypothetical protein
MRLRDPLRLICNYLVKTTRDRAKKLRVKKDRIITINYLFEAISEHPYCECCNKKFDLIMGKAKPGRGPNPDRPSIDRVNPAGDYTLNNIGIVCWRCNDQKRQLNEKLAAQILKYIQHKTRHPHAP